jgi:RNA polymerase sigma-70 factor, ECF subfamily
VSQAEFEEVLERSACKRFASASPSAEQLEDYFGTLYLADLGLACGCMKECEAAWECFIREYRGYLRAATRAMIRGSQSGISAEELADSLFADLYGLTAGKRGERSLLRYFHGRSSLKTWLRAILAQRHIDHIREGRRFESLAIGDGGSDGHIEKLEPARNFVEPLLDPHRDKYLKRFVAALEAGIQQLKPVDRQRLELYYSGQKTLAEIGKMLREHESSASRNLERTRRELRGHIEAQLRGSVPATDGNGGNPAAPLSDAEIALCFQYAAEEVPIDFRNLFLGKKPQAPSRQGERT